MKKKLAIIGTGIAGISCAHYLKDKYDISLFEKNDYLGGHTHTHEIKEGAKVFTLDTGFIVFNKHTYKNLLNLFAELKVDKNSSDMSFSVDNKDSGLQYGSGGFNNIFAQRKNIFSYRYLKFLLEIKKFFKLANEDYKKGEQRQKTLAEYCSDKALSKYFMDNFLVPIASAVWSTPHTAIYDFPINSLLPFFYNHGLLGLNTHFQWYTVKGGSNTYIKKIVAAANFDIHLSEKVIQVSDTNGQVLVETEKKKYTYDKVILASHADESMAIVANLAPEKRLLLESFPYNSNLAILHTDESIMPKYKNAWASWNHAIQDDGQGKYKAATTYWLNKLQSPATQKNYFLSINPFQKIDKDKVIKEIHYNHPLFTPENFARQKNLQELNKNTNIYFSGAYFGYGFHEDGLKAGLELVKIL